MISIIIVHYHVPKELFACLASIYFSKPKSSFEIIVIDNDEKKTIEKELKKQFPKVRYIKNKNKGFGQGNNVGVSFAKGEFLFFLNPDTIVKKGTIDRLVAYLKNNKKTGIVAPMLNDITEKAVSLQGARELTPLRAVFSFSFLNKIFPNNPIKKHYWYLSEWNKASVKEVDSIPGAAFVIRRDIYKEVGGFDEHFFLYFEEQDLCKRVQKLGWKIVMDPTVHVTHALGHSTKQSKKDISKIFRQSRFYYFRKHFGLFNALWAEFILRISKYNLLLFSILIVAAFLRLIHIGKSMNFIGDQGWFYLSARDMLLTGNIPFVGIASSHPWLHQGALWTYLLAESLTVFNFNPLSGVYLGTFLDLLTILLLYKFANMLFLQRTGLLAAVLYAVSPLVIANIRMPYHTSPIPFFTIVFLFACYKWVQREKYYFPLVVLCLALLYNLEIATFSLSIFVGATLFYGLIKKHSWATSIINPKVLFLSLLCFLIPMFPMIIYDFSHGFPQTAKFLAWVGYKLLIAVGFFPSNESHSASLQSLMYFAMDMYKQLVYPFNGFISLVIFIGSFSYIILQSIKRQKNAFFLLALNIFLIAGFFLAKTPSQAYLPVMFPGLILGIAYFFNWLLANKYTKSIVLPFFVIVTLFNCFYMFFLIYATQHDGFAKQITAAKQIVKDSSGKEYTIKGVGEGSQFASFTMNYEYLTWWIGHGPSKVEQPLHFIISEKNGEINLVKEIKIEK